MHFSKILLYLTLISLALNAYHVERAFDESSQRATLRESKPRRAIAPAIAAVRPSSQEQQHYDANATRWARDAVREVLVRRRYAAQARRIRQNSPGVAFWRKDFIEQVHYGTDEPARNALKLLRQQEAAELSLMFPTRLDAEVAARLPHLFRQFGDIEIRKITAVGAILRDYEAISVAYEGLRLEHDARTMLRAEMEEELKEVLGERDYFEYRLRNSQLAGKLRTDLFFFEPSEEEFRALFSIHESSTGSAPRQVSVLSALGSKRFQEYCTATQPDNYSLNHFLKGSGLSLSVGPQIGMIRANSIRAAEQIFSNNEISLEERNRQLVVLRSDTERKLGLVLGKEIADKYLQSPGRWVSAIKPIQQTRP